MNMKMKNSEMVHIVNTIISFQRNEAKSEEKRFVGKIKASYAMKKNRDKMLELLKPYEEERAELYQKYEIDKKTFDELSEDDRNAFIEALQALLNIEVDVPVYQVEISDMEGLPLTMEELEFFDFMIKEPMEFNN